MNYQSTTFPGVFILEPKIFSDNRGHFLETFKTSHFQEKVGPFEVVQENESFSIQHVFRGFHYQLPPFEQAKLVRVVSGRVLDIIIDLRPDSATFLQHLSVEISAENHRQLFIPKGFAHGFLTLSEQALFQYKVDNLWSKEHERSIAYNSPELKIDWPVELNRLIISEKDIAGMTLTAATAEILALQRQTLPRDLQPKNIEQPSILREK